MASFPDLGKKLSSLIGIPFPTIDLAGRELRGAGLLTVKGFGRGGAEMTARDAAILLISLLIDHKRGGDFVGEVKRVISLPLQETESVVHPDHFADGLSIKSARNAGEALESLIHDAFRSRIREPLEAGNDCLTIGIDPEGFSVAPGIRGPYYPEIPSAALYVFRRNLERKRRNVERNTIVHGRVLLEIAKLLELPAPS
jgi:hypothetical protein